MAILTTMRNRFYNNDGTVAAGGKVYTYVAGTTTPVATYTDNTGNVQNTNPIILDAKGEADIWSSSLIKVNVLQSDNTQVTGWPVDYIGSAPSIGILSYRGKWNATTNTPTLASGSGTRGYTYIVEVAGTTSIDGVATWAVEDYIAFNGTAWEKIPSGASQATSASVSAAAALASQVAAAASESASNASATLASQWATLTTGNVSATDYSSKAYAIGGTGVTSAIGAAKEWAITVGSAVIVGAYSAKEWAVGTFTRGSASGGSAKDWATYTSGTVDNAEYSAKKYANDAAASAASVNLPSITIANAANMIRVNAGGTGYETQTPAQVLSNIGAATIVANTFTGQQTFAEVKDTVHTITDGAAFEIDPINGSIQIVTLGASRTPAATNFEAGQTVILGIDDGTAYAVTWTTVAPVWVKAGGTASAPTLATTGYTWILLWKVGAVMYAAEVGKP